MIKEYRKLHNITQVELAKLAGVSQASISKHERKERKNCATCEKIRQQIFRMSDVQRKLECYEAAYKLAPMKMVVGKTLIPTRKKSFLRRFGNAIKHFIWG